MTTNQVGDRLRQLRKESGLSLRGIAELGHISAGFLSAVESGKRQPTNRVLHSYEQALGLELGALDKVLGDWQPRSVPQPVWEETRELTASFFPDGSVDIGIRTRLHVTKGEVEGQIFWHSQYPLRVYHCAGGQFTSWQRDEPFYTMIGITYDPPIPTGALWEAEVMFHQLEGSDLTLYFMKRRDDNIKEIKYRIFQEPDSPYRMYFLAGIPPAGSLSISSLPELTPFRPGFLDVTISKMEHGMYYGIVRSDGKSDLLTVKTVVGG